MRRGVIAGEFRAVDPTVAARMISSMFFSQALWCGNRDVFRVAGFPADDETALAPLTDFVIHALRVPGAVAAPHTPAAAPAAPTR